MTPALCTDSRVSLQSDGSDASLETLDSHVSRSLKESKCQTSLISLVSRASRGQRSAYTFLDVQPSKERPRAAIEPNLPASAFPPQDVWCSGRGIRTRTNLKIRVRHGTRTASPLALHNARPADPRADDGRCADTGTASASREVQQPPALQRPAPGKKTPRAFLILFSPPRLPARLSPQCSDPFRHRENVST